MASLRAAAVVEKQQEVDDCRLARNRVRYRAAIEEYRRCRGLGLPGRGFRSVGREYGIPPVWLRRFFNGEYQEGLDSTDADEGSSDEESSTGDF